MRHVLVLFAAIFSLHSLPAQDRTFELRTASVATIQQAVHDRTEGLSRSAREALQLAALLGHTFPLAPLRRVRPRVLEALREAENDGLIGLHDDQRGTFVHGLVADSLVHDIPAGTRVALHDELCRALQATHASPMSVACGSSINRPRCSRRRPTWGA